MWIVRLALRRPYTFTVMSILIAVLGALSIFSSPKDIFPKIDIPVVSVIWTYTGISPDDMEKRVITISERAMTTTVAGIEHMESQSLSGLASSRFTSNPTFRLRTRLPRSPPFSKPSCARCRRGSRPRSSSNIRRIPCPFSSWR